MASTLQTLSKSMRNSLLCTNRAIYFHYLNHQINTVPNGPHSSAENNIWLYTAHKYRASKKAQPD